MEWEWNGYNAIIKYRRPELGVGADVTLGCDPSYETPQFDVFGEFQPGIISFTLFSKCSCPGACPNVVPAGSGGDSELLTVTEYVLIGILVVVVVYVVGTVVYNKVVKQATGRELMPHPDFWGGLPGLVRDGWKFVFRRGGGKAGYESV